MFYVYIILLEWYQFDLAGNLPWNHAYDVAVIILAKKVELGKTIKIARLPQVNGPCPTGRKMIISGWGIDVFRPFMHREKLWAVMQECIDARQCTKLSTINPKENLLCVGDSENPLNNGCYGDSGGKFFLCK